MNTFRTNIIRRLVFFGLLLLTLLTVSCGDSSGGGNGGGTASQPRFVYLHFDQVTQKYVFHLSDGGSLDRTVGTPGFYGYATLSPDGKYIAYINYAAGSTAEVYVLDVNSLVTTRVTYTGIRQNYNVQWLDNTKLLYRSYRTGNFGAQLFISDLSGGNEQLLQTEYDICVHDPRVSPDGSRIIFYYHSVTSPHAIGSVNVLGTNYQTLNQLPGNAPAYSSDNAQFYYSDYSAATPQIAVAGLDGSNSKPLTSANSNYDPAPSGQQRVLYVQTDSSGRSEIYSMKPDGSGKTQVTNTGGNSFAGAGASIITP